MSAEKVKLFIVTYKRMSALHTTLKQIFDTTDFMKVYPNTEVVVINNHTNFKLDDYFVNKGVKVLHNDCRPDWSCGNLGRNWNEALLHGFKDLNNPDADIVIAMQNDVMFDTNWGSNLEKMLEKYTFVVGSIGDSVCAWRPEAVKKIGMWDERFVSISHKEGDYFIRALMYNKDKTCVGDHLHKRLINVHDFLPLETGQNHDHERHLLRIDTKHNDAWLHSTQFFYHKWKDTWKSQPSFDGWLINWSDDFVNNPPSCPKIPNYLHYWYFEKDIENLGEKNYVGFRKGDIWMTLKQGQGDIDTKPDGYEGRNLGWGTPDETG